MRGAILGPPHRPVRSDHELDDVGRVADRLVEELRNDSVHHLSGGSTRDADRSTNRVTQDPLVGTHEALLPVVPGCLRECVIGRQGEPNYDV